MNKYVENDRLKEKIHTYRPFDARTLNLIQQKLILEWTYNSNAIEGNTLTYQETSFYLLRGLTAKGRSLEEHLEMSNHRSAILFLNEVVKDEEHDLSERFIRELHQMMFKGISKIRIGFPGHEIELPIQAGEYKQQNNHVLKSDGSIHYYVDVSLVASSISDLICWYKNHKNKLHPIELAAKFHYEFVRIHPFADGNGRVARLLMNWILMKNHFQPVVIQMEDRQNYYDVLDKADQGHILEFIRYISKTLLLTQKMILSWIEGGIQPQKDKHPVHRIRKQKKWSQKQLSILSGVEQAQISRIENLKDKPQKKTLKKLAKALGVSVSDLES